MASNHRPGRARQFAFRGLHAALRSRDQRGITPVEAGLNFAVSYNKEFIGRDALLKQKLEKPEQVQVGFEMVEKGVAREHYPVLHNGQEVGL